MYENMITIDRASSESMQKQIRRQFAIAIINRNLPLHKPLPSIRKLAAELNVSLNTLILAYAALKQDGFIFSKDRSGYYINPNIYPEFGGFDKFPELISKKRENSFDFKRYFKNHTYDLPRITKPEDCLVRFKYPFICGLVDPDLFPIANWRECLRDSVNVVEVKNWAADFSNADDPMLIEQLIQRVLSKRGVMAHPSEVLITVGGQQALFIAIKMLLRRKGKLGVENPGYPDVANIALMESISVKPLPIDRYGLKITEQLLECKSIFVTPSHQFPSTVTMPLRRRKSLLKLSQNNDIFIIEDDHEAEISFNETPPPALKALDQYGNVIYTGSLSKSLLPGLRIGYIVADSEFIKEAKALRHHLIRHPAVNNQRSVALFLERGYFDRFLSRLTREYKYRSNIMSESLDHFLPQCSTPPSYGGGSFWVKLNKKIDTELLQQKCMPEGVYFEPGVSMFIDDIKNNYLRLGYSSIKSSLINEGISVLAKNVDQLLQ